MPSSVRDGTRPSAARMRVYSSAVMLCEASNCGVTATGSGTTTEEAVVITIAFIVARRLRWGRRLRPGHAWKKCGRVLEESNCGGRSVDSVRARTRWRMGQRLCDTFYGYSHPEPGWWNWQTQRTQNPPTARSWGFDPPSRHHKINNLACYTRWGYRPVFKSGSQFGNHLLL